MGGRGWSFKDQVLLFHSVVCGHIEKGRNISFPVSAELHSLREREREREREGDFKGFILLPDGKKKTLGENTILCISTGKFLNTRRLLCPRRGMKAESCRC